mgnify:CR=1 FL=1
MRAALIWRINDFSTYGMMSGWMTHSRLACLDDTQSFFFCNMEGSIAGLFVIECFGLKSIFTGEMSKRLEGGRQ